MKKIRAMAFLVLLLTVLAPSEVEGHNPLGYEILAYYGSTPIIDGMIGGGEWTDASIQKFNQTTTYFKHDETCLYVALNASDSAFNSMDSFAICIDIDDNGGVSFDSNDTIFGAFRNGTRVEVIGGGPLVPPTEGWNASVSSMSDYWQAEFCIEYSRLEIASGEPKILGIGLNSNDYPTAKVYYWPTDAHDPSLFADLVFREGTIAQREVFHVVIDSIDYEVAVGSNSTITDFGFNQSERQIIFNVTGHSGEIGFCNVTIPKNLLWGEFSVFKDGILLVKDVDFFAQHNDTHNTFYVTYTHTTHTIKITSTEGIPEFSSFLVLPLFMAAALLAATLYKKKKEKLSSTFAF